MIYLEYSKRVIRSNALWFIVLCANTLINTTKVAQSTIFTFLICFINVKYDTNSEYYKFPMYASPLDTIINTSIYLQWLPNVQYYLRVSLTSKTVRRIRNNWPTSLPA